MSDFKNKSNSTPLKQRLVRVDMMVGMTMLLVVVGHMSVGKVPHWYNYGLHNWIYSFHMEMFVFLSAFLIRYSYKGVNSIIEYGNYIWRKIKKFVPLYFIIGFGVALIACIVKGYTSDSEYWLSTLRYLFLYPRYSEASFLWYIYILLGYYLISPLFFKLPQWGRVVCCIGAMLLPSLTDSHFLCAYDFCQYTFFYCLGVLCAEWIEEIRNTKTWIWGLMSTPFIVFSGWLFGMGAKTGFDIWQLGWWTTVTGVAALPFFYLLAMLFEKMKVTKNSLTAISIDSYSIYLLQMFFIYGCAMIVDKTGVTDKIPFLVFVIITTAIAIVIPIIIMKMLRKIHATISDKKSRTQ